MQYDPRATGRVIRDLREKRKWTQEVTSGFAGIARSHLAQIEQGKKNAEVDTLWKIAEAFELRLSDLFRLVEEEIEKMN